MNPDRLNRCTASRYTAPSGVPDKIDRPRHLHVDPPFWMRIAIAVIATLLVGSLWAVVVLRAGGWTRGLPRERALLESLHTPLPAPLDLAVLLLPWLGTNLVFIPVLGPACWYLWRQRRRPDLATTIAVVTIGNYLLGTALKVAFERPRPTLWMGRGEYTGSSYPSGHAMAVTSVIGFVAVLLYEQHGALWPLAAWLMLLISTCYSRLYLGVHWPTDIVGGLLAGAVWLVGVLWARRGSTPE